MDRSDIYKFLGVEIYPRVLDEEQEKQQIKDQILKRIHLSIKEETRSRRFARFPLIPFGLAASVLLAVLIGVSLASLFSEKNETSGYVTLSVPKGKIVLTVLPDNSKVWLNAGSTVKYKKNFDERREIFLIGGGAYFEVKHSNEKPFIVHSGEFRTTVLGTSFEVKVKKNQKDIQVTVVNGKVGVGTDKNTLGVITRNQAFTYNKISKKFNKESVAADDITAWRKGEIIFRGAMFDELASAIENVYNVRIKYDKDRFSNCKNSIHFSNKQSLKEVLGIIKEIQGIEYRIIGGEVIITGKGC
jgi:ferric-dicitrate binding protein FerR (iron transport regulator)